MTPAARPRAAVAVALVALGSQLAACAGPRVEEAPAAARPLGSEAEASGTEAPERPSAALRVAVISDVHGRYGSTEYGPELHAAIDRIVALRPDLVLAAGDLVAGQRDGLDYRAMWRAFHAAVTDRLAEAGIPFAVTPGNHDGSGYARYAAERAIFVDEWRGRAPAGVTMLDDARHPSRYAFALGPALFVMLDATTLGPLAAEQREWLARVLREHGEGRVTLVLGHLPIRPVTRGREREVLADDALVELLVERRVAAYVSGHHHGFFPGRIGGLRVVSVGCLGAGPRALLDPEAPGEPPKSARSFVWLELGAEGITRLEALAEPSFDAAIDVATLPPRVGVPGAWTERAP